MPRTDPTEDHPATPRLQVRARVDVVGWRGGEPRLRSVVELYVLQQEHWTLLARRQDESTLDELLQAADWTRTLRDLEWYLDENDEDPLPE